MASIFLRGTALVDPPNYDNDDRYYDAKVH
jgi:hypothetical protein